MYGVGRFEWEGGGGGGVEGDWDGGGGSCGVGAIVGYRREGEGMSCFWDRSISCPIISALDSQRGPRPGVFLAGV